MSTIRIYQHGLGMIELMVGLLLSSMLLFGVLQIFDTNKRSSQVANAFSRVQESGRIAMEMVSRDIRMADYWGCTPDSDAIHDHLDHNPDTGYEPWMSLTGAAGISGVDNVAGSTSVGTITVKPGTDMFTMRGAARRSDITIEHPYMVVESAKIHINSGVDIPEGEVLLISDCNTADLFANTNDNTASGGINHREGTVQGGPNNAIKNLSRTYNGNAQILTPFVKTYFIGQPENGVWSLYREHNGLVSELVRDVEDMQIVYGEDTSGNGWADAFVAASDVDEMDNVISIRVTIEATSTNTAPGDPVRRNYSVTSNIRNRSL